MDGLRVTLPSTLFSLTAINFSFSSKAFLADDNLGDSLDGVEALIRKHEDFDKSFAAQAEKVNVSMELIYVVCKHKLYCNMQFAGFIE